MMSISSVRLERRSSQVSLIGKTAFLVGRCEVRISHLGPINRVSPGFESRMDYQSGCVYTRCVHNHLIFLKNFDIMYISNEGRTLYEISVSYL